MKNRDLRFGFGRSLHGLVKSADSRNCTTTPLFVIDATHFQAVSDVPAMLGVLESIHPERIPPLAFDTVAEREIPSFTAALLLVFVKLKKDSTSGGYCKCYDVSKSRSGG